LIDSVINLIKPRLILENIELEVLADEQSTIVIQKTGIQQVLSNLINNSIDALSSVDYPKKLQIRFFKSQSNYYISVKDNGIGIPHAMKDSIFTPFSTSKSHGRGLGLAICKQIRENHGGDITFHSKERETVFTLVFS
jgi:two-component system, sporulation sensor kinase D